jgi:hypothetical protein
MEPQKSIIMPIVLSIAGSAIVFGSAGYYLASMQEPLPAATITPPKTTATVTPITPPSLVSPSPTTDTIATSPSTTTKIYTNSKYNFSFSYPNNLAVKEDANAKAGFAVYFNGNATAADLSVYVSEYIKPLDSPSYTPEGLELWLKENKDYTNIKTVTIGGRSGFSAVGTDTMLNYFIPQKDKSIINIVDTKQNTTTKAIIDSLKFAK